jgi:signal transduction histidine kinase
MTRHVEEEPQRGRLVHEYTSALREYLGGAGEDALSRAYELGRAAVGSGVGVVELALLHHSVVLHVVAVPSLEEQERSAQFLAESLSPFELTHRGFREANERLEQLNRELRGKNQQLEQTTEELRQANEATREANRELEAFSHTVAHDLRSPLSAVIGFADLIEEGKDPATTRRFAALIGEAGRRMNVLIVALLEFARSARGVVQKSQVDLTAIVARIAAALCVQGVYTRAQITIAPSLCAYADPALIEIVLTNLLSNALKYSARVAAPQIEVGRVHEPRDALTFFVRDNGAGFDMAHVDKLFGAFQRLHSAEAFEGNGVGLATVQRIIRRHGGEIWAEGAVGQGAIFYFTLGKQESEGVED